MSANPTPIDRETELYTWTKRDLIKRILRLEECKVIELEVDESLLLNIFDD